MKKAIASAGLIALGATVVQTAHAEMAAGADKPWTVSATLRGFYDDNYNTQPDGPGRRSSYGVELRPQASINWSSGPTLLTASYTFSGRYYEDRPIHKWDTSHDFEFFLNHNFNERYALDIEESFVSAQEPDLIDPANPNSLPLRANGDNIHNAAGFNFHAQLTHLLGLVIGYSNNYYDYNSDRTGIPPAQSSYDILLNRFEHAVILNTRWQIQEQTVGILGYTFGAVDYNSNGSINGNLLPAVSAKTRDNYSHDIYVGVEHSFRSDLNFSGRAGIQVLDYYNDLSGNNSSGVSPFVDLSLSYIYMDGGSLTVGFHHAKNQTDQSGVGPNGQVTQDQESSTLSASVSQILTPLSPKLTASLNAEYQNSTYNGGTINNQNDNFYLVGLNFAYQFTHYFSAEVGYNYDLLQSDLAARGYNRNRVYIGVTASY